MEKLKEVIIKKQNKVVIFLLICIILLGIGVRMHVGSQKAYLHIDEGYSYGLMNYNKVDIMENEDFYNTWHTKDYYEEYLTIGKEEVTNFRPVYENQKNDVHPPFYYLLLRIAASFNIDYFSKWTGIILNIIIFIFSSIVIYLLTNKIFKNKVYALLLVLINSFLISSIESTIFIRMYALNALNLLIISYLHICNLDKDTLTKKQLIPMAICIIIGSLTHYYYLVFLFVLYVMYMIYNIRKKNFQNALKYTIMMAISALVSLAIFPYSFVHIFMGYRGAGAISNLENITQMWKSLKYLYILNNSAFNGVLIFILVIAIILYKLIRNKKLTIEVKDNKFWFMFIPAIFYFILIAFVSPYQEIRYIMPVCIFIVIGVFYILKILCEKVMSKKSTFILLSIIFISMLILPKIANIEISYLYKNYKPVVQKIEETHEIPMIYVLNKNNNRFLDDIYLYSKIDNSYILDEKLFSKEKVEQIFINTDISNGIYVMINEGIEHKLYLETILDVLNFSSYEHVGKMNACDIYKMKP